MPRQRDRSRRIVLLVEGASERSLHAFLDRWLCSQLPGHPRIGLEVSASKGVDKYLDDLPSKLDKFLRAGGANYAIGIVDLFRLPLKRLNISQTVDSQQRIPIARQKILGRIPDRWKSRFRQHFAVQELEAWMLAYPDQWPPQMRGELSRRAPESVDAHEPPSHLLKRLHRGSYQKVFHANRILGAATNDPQVAIDRCSNLKTLADDLLRLATILRKH